LLYRTGSRFLGAVPGVSPPCRPAAAALPAAVRFAKKNRAFFSRRARSFFSIAHGNGNMTAVNVTGVSNINRNEMVEWCNDILKVNYNKVENLCSGKQRQRPRKTWACFRHQ
jgi:hypothetical protein